MSDGRCPRKPFYGVFSIDNLDGTFVTSNLQGAYDTLEEAMERMYQEIEADDPLPHVVFKCVPVAMHKRQPMLISMLISKIKVRP